MANLVAEPTMEEKEANDTARLLQKNMDKMFSGEIYDELNKILEEEKDERSSTNKGEVKDL